MAFEILNYLSMIEVQVAKIYRNNNREDTIQDCICKLLEVQEKIETARNKQAFACTVIKNYLKDKIKYDRVRK